jgi:hypothetical protein
MAGRCIRTRGGNSSKPQAAYGDQPHSAREEGRRRYAHDLLAPITDGRAAATPRLSLRPIQSMVW